MGLFSRVEIKVPIDLIVGFDITVILDVNILWDTERCLSFGDAMHATVQTLMSTFMLGSPTTDGRRGSADRESLRSCAYCCRPTSRIWNRSQNPAEPTNDFYRTSLTRNTERGFLVENGSEMRPVACSNHYLFQLFYLAQPKRVKVVYELYIYVSSLLFFWCP